MCVTQLLATKARKHLKIKEPFPKDMNTKSGYKHAATQDQGQKYSLKI